MLWHWESKVGVRRPLLEDGDPRLEVERADRGHQTTNYQIKFHLRRFSEETTFGKGFVVIVDKLFSHWETLETLVTSCFHFFRLVSFRSFGGFNFYSWSFECLNVRTSSFSSLSSLSTQLLYRATAAALSGKGKRHSVPIQRCNLFHYWPFVKI